MSRTRKATTTDFLVIGEGPFTTVYLLHPLNDGAREGVAGHLPEDAQWLGRAINVGHRYIRDIVDGARNDGLAVR